MSDSAAQPRQVDTPWPSWEFPWNQWIQMFQQPPSTAPRELNQPILPGWTFGPSLTINETNSASPQTEADILAHYSYGRQLGRIVDAVSALVEQQPHNVQTDDRLAAFTQMARDVEAVKLDAAQARINRLLDDLSQLEHSRPDSYRQLRTALHTALERGTRPTSQDHPTPPHGA